MVKLWHICMIKFFQLLKTSKCVCINIFKSSKDSNLGKETSCKTVVVPKERHLNVLYVIGNSWKTTPEVVSYSW